MKTAKWLTCALCLLLPVVAFAGPESGVNEMNAVVNTLAQAPKTLMERQPFAETGNMLMGYLLAILFSWKSIKIMLDGGPIQKTIAELVNLILLYGIAKFFMDTTVQTQIAAGFDSLATMAAGATTGSPDTSDLGSMITNALSTMMDAAFKLIFGGPTDKQDSWSLTSINPVRWFMWLVTLLFRLGIAVLMLLSALIYCGTLFITYSLVSIGLVFAPLMVPWLLWDASAFVFNGWLKFMIVAGVQKIVAALVFGMTIGFVTSVDKMAEAATASWDANFYYYASCFLVTGIIAYLFMQIPTIANGLISGAPHTSFTPPRTLTPGGAMNRAAGQNTAPAGKMVMGGAKGAYQGGRSGAATGTGVVGTVGGAVGGAAKGAFVGAKNALKSSKGTGSAPGAPVAPRAPGAPAASRAPGSTTASASPPPPPPPPLPLP